MFSKKRVYINNKKSIQKLKKSPLPFCSPNKRGMKFLAPNEPNNNIQIYVYKISMGIKNEALRCSQSRFRFLVCISLVVFLFFYSRTVSFTSQSVESQSVESQSVKSQSVPILFDADYYRSRSSLLSLSLTNSETFDHFKLKDVLQGVPHSGDMILKILLMTANEFDLAKLWISHHGRLVGYHNLYILDSSTGDDLINLRNLAEDWGINYYYTSRSLNELDTVMTDILISIKYSSDFLLKLDTDEFLVIYEKTSNEIKYDRLSLEKYLASLPYDGQKYRIGYYANNIPSTEQCRNENFNVADSEVFSMFFPNSRNKTLFPSWTFKSIDLGSHEGLVEHDKDYFHYTNLAVLHYNFSPFNKSIVNLKNALVNSGYILMDETTTKMISKLSNLLAKNPLVASNHKVTYFLEYLRNPSSFRQQHCSGMIDDVEKHRNETRFRNYLWTPDREDATFAEHLKYGSVSKSVSIRIGVFDDVEDGSDHLFWVQFDPYNSLRISNTTVTLPFAVTGSTSSSVDFLLNKKFGMCSSLFSGSKLFQRSQQREDLRPVFMLNCKNLNTPYSEGLMEVSLLCYDPPAVEVSRVPSINLGRVIRLLPTVDNLIIDAQGGDAEIIYSLGTHIRRVKEFVVECQTGVFLYNSRFPNDCSTIERYAELHGFKKKWLNLNNCGILEHNLCMTNTNL